MTANAKLEESYSIVELLNRQLSIVPLIYGSLGLGILLDEDLNSQDMDFLVPHKYLNSEWGKLKKCIEESGYILIDLHEHEFVRDGMKIGFSFIEDLESYVGIKLSDIKINKNKGAEYLLLDLHQYLKVYSKSLTDNYRKITKNKKDIDKIKRIQIELEKRK